MHSYAINQDQQYKEEMEAHLRTIANQTPLASIANGFAGQGLFSWAQMSAILSPLMAWLNVGAA